MDICQNEARDLHECDDEGTFGQSSKVVADGSHYGGEDWSSWYLGLLPSNGEEIKATQIKRMIQNT